MNFRENKYTRIYFKIIDHSKNRLKPEGYTEKHHIIPKCKPFCGSNTKDNIAILTAREHYICHLLLLKMVETPLQKQKMYFAFLRMGSQNTHHTKRGSRNKLYEFFRKQFVSAISGKNSIVYGVKRIPWNKGKKNIYTQASLAKMSLAKKNKPLSSKHCENISKSLEGNTHLLGYKHSEISKKKISKSLLEFHSAK